MDMDAKKIQFYMAKDWDEYKEAIEIARGDSRVTEIKEVGEMETTDWDGNDMFAYIFVMTAPNSFMRELCDHMKVKTVSY